MPVPALPVEVVRIIQNLQEKGFQARLVGGCVRDRLLHRLPKDYDVATDATPDEVIALFTPIARKVLPTGKAFGTITVLMRTLPVEVTTLRTDADCDGRKAVVAFSKSFEEDAQRRDFTINALSQEVEGKIHDYCQGLVDLENKKIRFIGAPAERIREDYLRILRYFRFQLQLGFTGDPEAVRSIRSEAKGIEQLSIERVTQELRKILSATLVYPQLAEMDACGVLKGILPAELLPVPGENLQLLDCLRDLASEKYFLARLFLLSLRKGKVDLVTYSRLALTRQESKRLSAAQTGLWMLPDTQDIAIQMRWIDKIEAKGGEGSFLSFFAPVWKVALSHSNNEKLLESLSTLCKIEREWGTRRTTKMPLHGEDLQGQLHIAAGAPLGELLLRLQDEFRRGTWITREEGLHLAGKLWKSDISSD